ncbi:hypothetical protein RchiOBHm_Chr7g0187231 [Rosa chinensis]|uniref:Uncharacterized protein n=1 Tax=Rosa chinensis TaxID=74649 RepID=A0A2P6P482_ROSCH|nr:hypothetical protein RchiOBHm_Chr7g0187231 [Rosa chinensis]
MFGHGNVWSIGLDKNIYISVCSAMPSGFSPQYSSAYFLCSFNMRPSYKFSPI